VTGQPDRAPRRASPRPPKGAVPRLALGSLVAAIRIALPLLCLGATFLWALRVAA